MSEQFALCWNNFTDNITTGFQSLLVRGDLCDATLAVEGKLLKAHKVVLSICSPYFQEMFITMPSNQHPILILKDMSARLVSNLLEFIYHGSVNVKQDELQAFMKIAETLQIKGLTTTTKEPKTKDSSDKGAKRSLESEEEQPQSPKDKKAHIDLTNDDDADQQAQDDQFQIIPIPEISMDEARFDMNSKSRESTDVQPLCNLKIVESQTLSNFGPFDYNNEQNHMETTHHKNSNSNAEIPNEVPPSGSNITMLSSTSLLHGNCIFNRNNTVATQAGLKTYWLCKSYRISMCKARCITHQNKVISATGVHNHLPHMSNKPQEIPPGHTPNPFNPSTSSHEYHTNSNPMPSLSQQMHHQNIAPMMHQPPYHYQQHPMHQSMMEHPLDPRHCNNPNVSPPSDTKMYNNPQIRSSSADQIHCKVEHI